VLVKNDKNTLPFDRKKTKKVLVCGPGAAETKSSMGR